MIPKGISRVKEAVRATKGNYGAKRVERAADEIANLEKMYTDEALRQAFSGDNAKALMTMNPADFENYAAQLHYKRSVGPNAAKLASQGDLSKHTMSTEDYLKFLRELPEGFNDIPYLQISKQETGLPLMPYITGHEGRHRSRALAGSGEQKSLVRLMPNYELRESLPRRSQEEYIEALKEEMAMTGNKVKPETYFDNSLPKNLLIERPPIELPDLYAKGGEVDIPELDFDDKESANLYKYAMKTLGLQGEQSGAGAGANIPLGGGNLNLGVNFNKLSTMPNQMMQTLDASYGKNINGIGVNANVSKPMDIEGVYQGMLSGSIPVGLGKLMLGLQAQKTPYGSGVTGYTAGYQGKVGDGMLSATINQPRNRAAGRTAQVQYQMPFAKGGAVEYNPAEIDTIASSLYEELYG